MAISELDMLVNAEEYRKLSFIRFRDKIIDFNVEEVVKSTEFKHLKLVQFKDLKDWKPQDTGSKALQALCDKLEHMMFNIGAGNSVLQFLKAVVSRTKRIYDAQLTSEKHGRSCNPDDSGYPRAYKVGHFRWNHQVYLLSKEEVYHLLLILASEKLMDIPKHKIEI